MSNPGRIAYMMSRFPKLTETFVLYEMLEIRRLGFEVELYPLLRAREATMHPEAEEPTRRAHFRPFLSTEILAANWRRFRRSPVGYLRLWFEVLRHALGSANFFFGAIGILPKTVLFAEDMQRRGVRHVHAHFANHPALAALIVHRLTGIPYSFTAHGSDLHVERRLLDRKVASAAFVVAISSYNRDLIVRECGEQCAEKIRLLHCGVDTELLAVPASSATGEALRILSVGALGEVKGHRYLVEACDLLQRGGIDFRCEIVGEGPQRAQLERQIRRLGLTDRVRLLGSRSRPEVLKLLARSNVAVLASVPTRQGKREGIPVALMEAMAAGRPVIASDLSGIPELVESGTSGFLVAPADAPGLAEALTTLGRDHELRRTMGRAGRLRIVQRFDIRKNAAELGQLFLSSVATCGGRDDIPCSRPGRKVSHELQAG
jgi:colanic acid/amylovoran biosynthesis glycosyltransferase